MTQFSGPFSTYSSDSASFSRPLKACISLPSFKKNIATIKSNIGSSEIIVVVKADAYGHGLLEISKAAGNHSLAVAVPEELLVVREAGLKNRVWVLEGPFSLSCLKLSENVVWVVHSLWQIELIEYALSHGTISELDVCIKLDTGMHRLGFVEAELFSLKVCLNRLPQINIVATMTHFSMSDYPGQESVCLQIKKFDELVKSCQLEDKRQTLANSGGIMNYAQSHRDWVRPGIMLYSGELSSENYKDLEPVMSFESAVIALRSVKSGEPVGYGATWVAQKDSIIATVAVGYADGYPRHAPNGTPVAIHLEAGDVQFAALVGRVSMDMITIDVTDIKGVNLGDRVQLWGDLVPVGEVARLAGTISYELLTSVSKRVPRIYQY